MFETEAGMLTLELDAEAQLGVGGLRGLRRGHDEGPNHPAENCRSR